MVEKVYDAREGVPMMLDAWVATLAFSGQIFCDFAGYSTTAIGVALCLGFAMPDNFRFPYAAVGFSDFWRRWHITLSSWLRDYLYIPLGGNRTGRCDLRRLDGHDAARRAVARRGLDLRRLGRACTAFILAVERWLRGRFAGWSPGPASIVALGLLTYILVNITWVFFRAKDFTVASTMLVSMAGVAAKPVPMIALLPMIYAMVIVGGIVATHWAMRDKTLEIAVERTPAWVVAALLGDHGHRDRRGTGERQCLHLLPVLSRPNAGRRRQGRRAPRGPAPDRVRPPRRGAAGADPRYSQAAVGPDHDRASWSLLVPASPRSRSTRAALGLHAGDLDNSEVAWVKERVRSEAAKVAIVGDSRILFDTDLDRFEALTGMRPVQLAIHGTSALTLLEDVATNENFRGLLIVGLADTMFFQPFDGYGEYVRRRGDFTSPSGRIGHRDRPCAPAPPGLPRFQPPAERRRAPARPRLPAGGRRAEARHLEGVGGRRESRDVDVAAGRE